MRKPVTLATIAVLAATVTLPAEPADAALRRIVVQREEMSCGASALATLVGWAGYPRTEAELLRLARDQVLGGDPARLAKVEAEGLSATELAKSTAALGLGLELRGEILSLDDARRLAGVESFIVHLVDGDGKDAMRRHFTVITGWDPRRGFLRADGRDGRHFFQPERDFARAALNKRGDRLLALRLHRSGRRLVLAESASPAELRGIPDLAAARLLSAAVGGARDMTSVTLALSGSRERLSLASGTLDVRGATASASLSIQHSRGSNTLTAELPLTFNRTELRLDGNRVGALSATAGGGAAIGAFHAFGLEGAAQGRLKGVLDASLQFGSRLRPEGLEGGAALSWAVAPHLLVNGRLGLHVGGGDGKAEGQILPSLGTYAVVGENGLAHLGLSGAIPLAGRPASANLRVGYEHAFSQRWGIASSAWRSILGPPGYSAHGATLSITYRFRRSHLFR